MLQPIAGNRAAALKVYFDLSAQEDWARREWDRNLSALRADPGDKIALVSTARAADLVVRAGAPQIASGWARDEIRHLLRRAPNTLVWDNGDHPTGWFNGLYCSLDRRIFDPKRHATLSYPVTYNEIVDFGDPDEAKYDFMFYGGITSGVRRRLVGIHEARWKSLNARCHVESGPWHEMLDRTGGDSKKRYAAALKQAKFILCPRGNGCGSVRLFETLKTGRVPIILSDRYVLPSHIDWESCSIVLPEAQLASIPSVVSNAMDRWPAMARAARKVWEDNFSDTGLLGYMGKVLPPLANNRGACMTSIAKGRHLIGLGRVAAEMQLKRQAGRILSKLGR